MKKTMCFLGILGLLSILPAQAYQTLSSVDVFRYSQKSFVLSDNFTSYESCVSTKKENDSKYLNYKRSECFSDGKGFKYFICDGTTNCVLTKETPPNEVNQVKTAESPTPETLTSVTISAKNKAQLDAYLQKLEKQKSKYKNVEDYIKQLEKTSSQLGKLSAKYEKNSQVKAMLDYLDQGVKKIITTTKVSSEPVDDVAQLLCELEENCEERQVVIEDGKLEPRPAPTPVPRLSPTKPSSSTGASTSTGVSTTPAPNPTPPSPPVPPVVGGDSPIIQGMYRLTQKNYKGDFMKSADVCATEFGNEWSVSKETIDAHIMTAKTQKAWMNVNTSSCNNYSSHVGETGMSYLNNGTTKNVGCNNEMKVACIKQPAKKQENYKQYLKQVTFQERDNFMKQVESELASKITSDNNFVYINNYFALSKEQITAIDYHENPNSLKCPTGYSIARSFYDGKNNSFASNYTLEVLGYYLTQNTNAHQYSTTVWQAGKYGRYYDFWIQPHGTVQGYFDKFTLEQIKERGYDVNHETFGLKMGNGYLENTTEWRTKELNDKRYFIIIGSVGGSSIPATEKRSILCQKTGVIDSNNQYIQGLNTVANAIVFPENARERAEAFDGILYGYQSILAAYNWKESDFSQDYFLPIYKNGQYYFYWKVKEGFNTITQTFD